MERKEGYYWVKVQDGADGLRAGWRIAHYLCRNEHEVWEIVGSDINEDVISEIDERPIIKAENLPKTFNVKKGMSFERHLLENYYVALQPLPIPNAETAEWVTINKGCSVGPTVGVTVGWDGYIIDDLPIVRDNPLLTPDQDTLSRSDFLKKIFGELPKGVDETDADYIKRVKLKYNL